MGAAVIAFGCALAWFAAFVCAQLALMRGGAAGARSLLAPFAAAVVLMIVSVVVVLHGDAQGTLLAAVLSLLTIACLFVLYVPAVLLIAAIGAVFRDRIADRLTSVLTLVGLSLPEFVVGTLLVLLLAITLPWFPALSYF